MPLANSSRENLLCLQTRDVQGQDMFRIYIYIWLYYRKISRAAFWQPLPHLGNLGPPDKRVTTPGQIVGKWRAKLGAASCNTKPGNAAWPAWHMDDLKLLFLRDCWLTMSMVHAIVYPGTNESCPHLIAIEKWGKNTLILGYPMFKFSGQNQYWHHPNCWQFDSWGRIWQRHKDSYRPWVRLTNHKSNHPTSVVFCMFSLWVTPFSSRSRLTKAGRTEAFSRFRHCRCNTVCAAGALQVWDHKKKWEKLQWPSMICHFSG